MGVDVNKGAAQIAQLLQPEQPSDSAPEPETVEQPETVEESQDSAPELESDEGTTEETPEGDTESEDPTYTVKVNGEEVEVSLEDMRKGYMMESDYRRKTSEVSEQRKEIQAKMQDLDTRIGDAEMVLQIELEDLNSAESLELKEIDPSAYFEKREKIEAKQKKLQELKSKRDAERVELSQETVAKERELTLEAIPEWLDEDVLKSEAKLVNQQLSSLGFTNEELSKISDHRLIVLTRKAALYDKIKSAKPEDKIVKSKPKSAKAGTATTKEDRVSQATKDKRAKLRKTGNMRDAASTIKSLLR
jgi:hypothetical protein